MRIRPKHRNGWTAVLAAGAVTLLVAASAGCEQRVVRTQNTWIGSQTDHIELQPMATPQPRRSRGPLQSVGDTLFGWMGGSQQQPTQIGTDVPLEDRMGAPTEMRSPNTR